MKIKNKETTMKQPEGNVFYSDLLIYALKQAKNLDVNGMRVCFKILDNLETETRIEEINIGDNDIRLIHQILSTTKWPAIHKDFITFVDDFCTRSQTCNI
jgi:hypothetical protein